MKQVLIIHGGNSWPSYERYRKELETKELSYEKLTHPIRWKERLQDNLPDFDVIYPSMPNSLNAVYDEWVVYFKKLLPFLGDNVQISGHSLRGMFLAKHLTERPLDKKVRRLILISGAYNFDPDGDGEDFFVSSVANLPKSAAEIHLFHSEDDPVVPFSELSKFQKDLPDAISHVFVNRGHFIDETFPEILELLVKE